MRKLKIIIVLVLAIQVTQLKAQNSTIIVSNYKKLAESPSANFYEIVNQVRLQLSQKRNLLISQGIDPKKNENFREENALFERWVYNWQDKISVDGKFPNASSGWVNARNTNPELLSTQRTNSISWTSIGPVDSSISNGWTYGAGIGRINSVKQDPVRKNILYAGSAAGGIFKSTDHGLNWTPITDNFAGLGVSDILIDPTNTNILYLATGDYDASHMSSIGLYKSTDAGVTWNVTGLTFNLSDNIRIGHVYLDPENANTIYATTNHHVYKSINGAANFISKFNPGVNYNFNDIVKIVITGTKYVFVTDKGGELYRSTDDGETFASVHNNGTNQRLDFAYSPAAPNTLFLLAQSNPALAKYNITTNTTSAYSNITNANPADGNANFNTQQGYNQVIAVSPTNADSIWVGEFSGGKLSINGGTTWQNKFNGYYDPANTSTNWGGFYVHSDHHDFQFIGSDSLLIGNDGGVYIGKISTNDFKQRFNGLVTTQSYSMAIFDSEPNNLITGNQDNDGSSRVFTSGNSKWYGAQAGDGTSTAISITDHKIRYLGGTNGSLSYRTDAFETGFSGNSITTPTGAPFIWDMQMHSTNGGILYGGFGDISKMTGGPTGTWTDLGSGAVSGIKMITLANNDATKQKIIIIDGANNIRKSENETTWSTILSPVGTIVNSVYASKTNWDTVFATTTGYTALNKVFFSTNNGSTWNNVTKNMPNIAMKKVVLYQGTDTVFVGTELGVFFAKVTDLVNGAVTGAWSKYGGNTLPNVRVEDLEISYTKNQLFISTFGRGVWVADLKSSTSLALNNIQFGSTNANNNGSYNLHWNVGISDLSSTTLQKSESNTQFIDIANFADNKKVSNNYNVTLSKDVELYRLKCTKTNGASVFSSIIKLNKNQKSTIISVYPNPTKGYIFVNSSQLIDNVKLLSINGKQQCYASPKNNVYSFDMSLLPKGIYIIQVTDLNGKVFTEKVIRD